MKYFLYWVSALVALSAVMILIFSFLVHDGCGEMGYKDISGNCIYE